MSGDGRLYFKEDGLYVDLAGKPFIAANRPVGAHSPLTGLADNDASAQKRQNATRDRRGGWGTDE